MPIGSFARLVSQFNHSLRTPLSTIHSEIAYLKTEHQQLDLELLEKGAAQLKQQLDYLNNLYTTRQAQSLSSFLEINSSDWNFENPVFSIIQEMLTKKAVCSSQSRIAVISASEDSIKTALTVADLRSSGFTELELTLFSFLFDLSGLKVDYGTDEQKNIIIKRRVPDSLSSRSFQNL